MTPIRTPSTILAAVLLLGGWLPPVPAQDTSNLDEGLRGALDTVTASDLRDTVYFLASDYLEGRDTPSRGLDVAAHYLASRFRALGLRPAGDDGSYLQQVGFASTTFSRVARLSITSITELISDSNGRSRPITCPVDVAVGSRDTLSRPTRNSSLASDSYERGRISRPTTAHRITVVPNPIIRHLNRNRAR